ncbi:probable ATP synthase subunit epsilon, mitochondrial [Coccomyxa sp. Obi]|nr:probable ATP synthase subunit epsilon, mitochondrial [Coccomyxa sp. Obi]
MSSSAAASSYWRVAGMSYLKYSNLCADMLRSSLKEPMKTKAKLREAVYFRAAVWKDGKPEKQVITDLTDTTAEQAAKS